MKVKALTTFVGRDGNGNRHVVSAGDEFELPPGVDWLKCSFVEPVKTSKRQKATKEPEEKAVIE